MTDTHFRSKYHKYKIRVKLWESEFMEKYGRKPNKNDIKLADITIREAYKIYWKLKTEALEETLADINFSKSATSLLPIDIYSKFISYPEYEPQAYKSKNNLIESECLKLKNNSLNDILPNITAIKSQMVTKPNINDKCHINISKNYLKNNETAGNDKSSFQLSQNMCKSLNFSKRNPRKSFSILKLQEQEINLKSFTNQRINSESNKKSKISNIINSSFNNDLQIFFDEKNLHTERMTIQKLIETSKISNKQLNSSWLKRCISDNSMNCSVSNIDISVNKNLQNNQLLTDEEDYIHNSDSEDEKNKKRIRNFKKILLDGSLRPPKRLCKFNNDFDESVNNNNFLSNFGTDNKIVFSKDYSNTINLKNYICNKNPYELQIINDSQKNEMIKIKKTLQDPIKNTVISSYAQKKIESVTNKTICANQDNKSIECETSQTSKKNIVSSHDKPHSVNKIIEYNKDTIKFSCFSNPLDLENNTPLTLKEHNKNGLKQKVSTKNLNENFLKLNLKKKVFVHGKKLFNLSKYKKNQWKENKKIDLLGTNMKLSDSMYIQNRCTYSKYGTLKLKQCKSTKNESIFDINMHSSSNLTLNEVEELKKINTVRQHNHYISDIQNDNMLSSKFNILVHHSNFINSKTESDLENQKLIIKKDNDNFLKQIHKIYPLYELEPDLSVKDTPLEVLAALKKFGYNAFRPGQEKAIMRILSGQSTLVILATGSGKSLCYQLPAYMYAKKLMCITLVISPLISLMDDQVSKISNFLHAGCLHSNQSLKQQEQVLENLKKGKLKILLVAPEMITNEGKLNGIENIKHMLPPIAFACIDEVHCISQWSHNFRPSYLTVCKVLRKKFGVKVILGLTATATKSTVMNIINVLNIKDGMEGVISEQSLPSNLNLTISRDESKEEALIQLLENERFIRFNSIIIYCTRREECIRVAKFLRMMLSDSKSKQTDLKYKISVVEVYHAGLSAYRRKIVQNAFMNSEVRIVVATVAFGMGLNKSNIRAVIHFNMPASFEEYVQEIGRAGRDGVSAYCHLFLSSKKNSDECELRRHIYAKEVDRHTIRRLLQKVFISCYCFNSYVGLRCQGHEVYFPIDETVKILDISKEIITTLLCYLELHQKRFITLLSPAYTNVKISSYIDPNGLKLVAQSSQLLELIFTFLKQNGYYKENSSTVEFSIIDVAVALKLDSDIVRKEIKRLELIFKNEEYKSSAISIQFDTLSFRCIVSGDLTNDELEEALESLSQQNQLHKTESLQRLKFISTTLKKYSFDTIKPCLNFNQKAESRSEELKKTINNYFELDEPLQNDSIILENELIDEESIITDIRNLLITYKDIQFTGRSVARIFHGIQSPNFSAFIWSKCRFWRSRLTDDFNTICQLAIKEILNFKEIK